MATRAVTLRRQFLGLCVWLLFLGALSQNGPQVLPPAGSSNVTYDSSNNVNGSDVNNLVPTTLAPPPKTDPAGARTAATASPTPCTLVTVYPVRDVLQSYLIGGAKLIQLDLTLASYPPDFLQTHLKHVYHPTHWVRSTGRQGRSLLVLEDNYDFMSLFFLSIGVFEQNVTLRDSPRNCLRTRTPEEILHIINMLLLNDFKPQGEGQDPGSLSVDEHVCHMTIKEVDGYAQFRYTCCHLSPDGEVMCSEVSPDDWIDVLMAFIVITKVLVVLFSPSFLPGSLYRLKYVAIEYLYRIPDNSPVKRMKVVVTQYPGTYGNDSKVVKLSEVSGMEYFKTMVDTNMQLDRIYHVTFDRVRLSVKSRRLLGENHVPVGLLRMLYNNLLRCRIRHLEPLKDCCQTNLLGRLNPGLSCPRWFTCCKAFAKLVLLLLLVMPWIIRICIFFAFEEAPVVRKTAAAEALGMRTSFRGSLTLYLTPLHVFFVFIYIILVVDSVVYGVLSKRMKEKLKMVLRKCLRDMRERSRIAVCSWATWVLVMPFRVFGLLGILLFLPYLLVVLPLAVPVAAFYLFPALNLTIRLIIHFFLFMCPAKMCSYVFDGTCQAMAEKWERFSERFSKVREQLDFNKVTAEENFDRGHKMTKKDIILQIVVILMVLISFWSLTFLLMEVVSFVVEMGIYTLMGIIVNAGALLQYITVGFLVLMYGRASFSDVHNTYLTYHKKIHGMLMDMKKEEINTIARQEAVDQENTALRVQGNMAQSVDNPDVKLVVKEGKPFWRLSSVLMFLDRQDTPFTPEKFFYDAILLNYYGAPGPLYKHFLAAFLSFGKILVFLFFVFVVVMAFGDAYSVSTTNQLLATAAGGFIPFLFRFIFSTAGGLPSLHTDSVQFLTQFHAAINRYTQSWPIYDIIPIEFGEGNPRDSLILNSTGLTDTDATSPADHIPDTSDVRVEMEEVDEDDGGGVDMVVDVSTAESRRRGPLGLREAGSASMLAADSFGRAPVYRPPAARPHAPRPHSEERAIDV
ncbi:uncharacterized protein LOC143284575 isoform X2 [Babylonia areolata]|uniref:uncharacterized protein LOC143284575 isoform X2 n=1 Tax=Babylonia areolata TaxID=304850 RepID=UPI003FCFD787